MTAQNGSFVVPEARRLAQTDFAYWDFFRLPPGASGNYNYNNPPALLDGLGMDDEGNMTTAFTSRVNLIQTATPSCFVTSSGALYSFSEVTAFAVPYVQPTATAMQDITNVIFQVQTGGRRIELDNIELQYTNPVGETYTVGPPVYRAQDDPQTGAFSERLVTAFQWDLTDLQARSLRVVLTSSGTSMPLWQAQLDVVSGRPFERELGYLLFPRARPVMRGEGRPGTVDKNLPAGVDGRFFAPGQQLNLLAAPELDWEPVGFWYDGVVFEGWELPFTFPESDVTVTALFAPLTYEAWRDRAFYHENVVHGIPNDHVDPAVSGPLVDHDHDGFCNQLEYAFGGDPYVADPARIQPETLVVTHEGVRHAAIRYRTNGAPAEYADVATHVMVSPDLQSWQENGTTPGLTVTEEISNVLQDDGSRIVTARVLQPLSATGGRCFMRIEVR